MIKSVTITNYLQESVKIVLTEPESSGFIIRSIEGLGPAKANINLTELATLDGALDNGALLNTRNIVMSLIFVGTPTIEDTRLKSYKYFPIKQNLTFEIETDNRHCYTVGRVESNTPTIFGDDREGCQISILCPNSYFQDMQDTTVSFMAADSGFEFPFENNSLSGGGKNLLYLDMARWYANNLLFDAQPNNVVNISGKARKKTTVIIAKSSSLTPGYYYLTGCPEGGSASSYNLKIGSVIDTGNGCELYCSTSGTEYTVSVVIAANYDLGNKTFRPVLRRMATIDGQRVPIGEDLLERSNFYTQIDGMTIAINYTAGTVKFAGSGPTDDEGFSMFVSRLTNIPNENEYILSGSPTNSNPNNPIVSMQLVNSAEEVVGVDAGTGVTFTKDSDEDYSMLKIHIAKIATINSTFYPMIRDSSITDPTFEPHQYIEDAGRMIEFGSINATPSGNVFYLGDAETGMNIEIHANGLANGIGLYRFDTNEQMTINDTRLIGIVGSGIRAGDTIIISTQKGDKRIRLLRDGVYYNILNALNAPISWFNLRKGDNGFWLNATYGVSNLQYKVTYRTLYEGV